MMKISDPIIFGHCVKVYYKDVFEKKHGTKLGFMGFFTKACVQALKDIPAVNAEIDGSDLIYKNYYHVGVAVGTDKGLVVPVVRDCDSKSISDIEKRRMKKVGSRLIMSPNVTVHEGAPSATGTGDTSGGGGAFAAASSAALSGPCSSSAMDQAA